MGNPGHVKESGGISRYDGQHCRSPDKTGERERIKKLTVVIAVDPGRLLSSTLSDLGQPVAVGHAVREAKDLRAQQANQGKHHEKAAPARLSAKLIEKPHA